ncbi:Uu.00g004170.m01.CDS01 [Anthostomella pinea]|uniref:Uu.00g004170.m01.CDS01 n=1 Tax=Anthostomella pinea TaxID=933095 RepID=A0AAI8YIT2_9PEZI|nr:Uu.00g004170.m01.CDS01 [Anthostomella pinea]
MPDALAHNFAADNHANGRWTKHQNTAFDQGQFLPVADDEEDESDESSSVVTAGSGSGDTPTHESALGDVGDDDDEDDDMAEVTDPNPVAVIGSDVTSSTFAPESGYDDRSQAFQILPSASGLGRRSIGLNAAGMPKQLRGPRGPYKKSGKPRASRASKRSGPPRPRGPRQHGVRSLAKWHEGAPDEHVQAQPDLVFTDQSLTMPLDGPELHRTMLAIEADDTLCFKMRWHVARHLRRTYTKLRTPITQLFTSRIRTRYYHVKTGTPYNRLDFEAMRALMGFRRDQPGWADESRFKMLQVAYEQFGWDEVITDANVDDVLLEAGVPLEYFQRAPRVDRAAFDPAAFGISLAPVVSPIEFVREVQQPLQPAVGGGMSNGLFQFRPFVEQRRTKLPSASRAETETETPKLDPPPFHVDPGSSDTNVARVLLHMYEELRNLRTEVRELKEASHAEREVNESIAALREAEVLRERQLRETLLGEMSELRELVVERGRNKRKRSERAE